MGSLEDVLSRENIREILSSLKYGLSYLTIKELAFFDCGLSDEESLEGVVHYFSLTFRDRSVAADRLAAFRKLSLEEKTALIQRVDTAFRRYSPDAYYAGMIDAYQQFSDAIRGLSEVRAIIEGNLLSLSEYPYSRRMPALLRRVSAEQAEKIGKYVPKDANLNDAFVAKLKERIVWLDQTCLYNFHKRILEFAKKKLGKDRLDVHVDIVSNINTTLDSVLADSSFGKITRISDDAIGYRILRTSGKGKLAVLVAVLGYHNPYHEPENQWSIVTGKGGYNDLVEEGPPWGAVLETCALLFEEYARNPGQFEYRSVSKTNTKADDDSVMSAITSKFGKYISFSGFAPCFYDHRDVYWHRVVEFDYRRISADKDKAAEAFLEDTLASVKEIIQHPAVTT